MMIWGLRGLQPQLLIRISGAFASHLCPSPLDPRSAPLALFYGWLLFSLYNKNGHKLHFPTSAPQLLVLPSAPQCLLFSRGVVSALSFPGLIPLPLGCWDRPKRPLPRDTPPLCCLPIKMCSHPSHSASPNAITKTILI